MNSESKQQDLEPWLKWKVGDIVSRDGTDEQEIIEIDNSWLLMTVKCVKESAHGWCKIGDIEPNLVYRYHFIRSP